ncbi:MAG: hypothetical protein ABIA93_06840 [Candidatus Woesearchaeota archaeon]
MEYLRAATVVGLLGLTACAQPAIRHPQYGMPTTQKGVIEVAYQSSNGEEPKRNNVLVRQLANPDSVFHVSQDPVNPLLADFDLTSFGVGDTVQVKGKYGKICDDREKMSKDLRMSMEGEDITDLIRVSMVKPSSSRR